MNFSQALDLIKEGKFLSRAEWKSSDTFVSLTKITQSAVNGCYEERYAKYNWYICLRNRFFEKRLWLPSHMDLFALDWIEVNRSSEKEECYGMTEDTKTSLNFVIYSCIIQNKAREYIINMMVKTNEITPDQAEIYLDNIDKD